MQSAGDRPNRREELGGEANWTRQALSAARTRSPPFPYPPFPALSRPSWFVVDATLHGSGAPLFWGPSQAFCLFFFFHFRVRVTCQPGDQTPGLRTRPSFPALVFFFFTFTMFLPCMTSPLLPHTPGKGKGMA